VRVEIEIAGEGAGLAENVQPVFLASINLQPDARVRAFEAFFGAVSP